MTGIAEVRKNDVESPRFITHAHLDRCLGILARSPERFVAEAHELGTTLDACGIALEISDPSSWRGVSNSPHVPVERQFRAEIELVQTLGREDELRLAIRIEFAKIRLGLALKKSGLDREALAGGAALPADVRRRKREWHALRLEMFERNLYLVLINVERYVHTTAERSDLIQAGAATLFRAVDGFDWRRGLLFRTNAVHWLTQGFLDYLYNFNSTIRVPVYQQKSLKHIHAAIQLLGDSRTSLEDISGITGIRTGRISSILSATRRTGSLEYLEGAGGLASQSALRSDADPYRIDLEDASIDAGVKLALGRLNDRERRVVELRFGIDCGREHIYAEIAQLIGVSLERARQILVRALSKMRTPRLRQVHDMLAS